MAILKHALFSFLVAAAMATAAAAQPADDWPVAEPGSAGFAPDAAAQLDAAFDRGELPDLHAVLVARHGKLVLERYFEGTDESWGTPLGHVRFGPETRHDLRSISKSVVGLLYGIALERGLVPGVDAPVLERFPDYADLGADVRRGRIRVRHALTMTMGTAWDESLPYTDRRNSEIAMERSRDRYRYVLARPMVAEPGERWNYNGGATALLGHLIAAGSGKTLLAFAREHLFEPLGISQVDWASGADGVHAAASGLRMRPRDLARIGQLVLDEGNWRGRQVVPRDWLKASFQNPVQAQQGLGYGYQWWLGRGRGDGRRWIAGFGNGGQRLIVIPDLQLVVAVTAGAYNRPRDWETSVKLMRDIVLPAVSQP